MDRLSDLVLPALFRCLPSLLFFTTLCVRRNRMDWALTKTARRTRLTSNSAPPPTRQSNHASLEPRHLSFAASCALPRRCVRAVRRSWKSSSKCTNRFVKPLLTPIAPPLWSGNLPLLPLLPVSHTSHLIIFPFPLITEQKAVGRADESRCRKRKANDHQK
jgi:hypothetical protein